ncbi:MAG: chromosome partition protein MukB, partial [Kofleriaceae bacterium]
MSRARISALVLVNWKGVFYERYLLDRHVTALEGANGAGKTTVMIAAYVALLPDMSKLRFTNLGESGAVGGDRGIWGRLGEAGRPSYTVLDLELEAGERLLAGVRLVRTTEPTVEPTAFVITGLRPEVRLADVLLERRDDGDHVPELDELRAAVVRAGGELEVFRTIKEYFAALFERGITPMRLAGDEERGKLNEMLRTSMTGGISRALTSELRGFLLKEESGLGDTLSRMRANLEACRRTRAEVSESRQLEKEISAIYEAGVEMFGAAVHATRAAAAEAMQRVSQAQPQVDEAMRQHRELEQEIARLAARDQELEARRAAARTALATATAERDRSIAIDAVKFRLGELERELAALAATAQDHRARQALATAERAATKSARAAALEAYDRAAVGLAHLQQGLDELVRRAHAHRQLQRRLAEARTLLDRPALAPEAAAAVLGELDAERARIEAERARLDRESRDLATRRTEYVETRGALAAIDPASVAMPPGELHGHARVVLARLAEREALLGRVHELERDHAEAERLATRQHAAQELAARLGLAREPGAVARELDAAERVVRDAEDEARREAAAVATPQLEELRTRLAALDERLASWHAASAAVARLAAAGPAPATRADVLALRDRLTEDHVALGRRRAEIEAAREQLQRRAVALERTGTSLDPDLLRLRDELGGELLAERFEDLDVDAAGWVEARLGPLTQALIVDDPVAAARAIGERALDTVWLVAAGSELEVTPPERSAEPAGAARDVVTVQPYGLRVSRWVDEPQLGRRARERQLAELHAAIAREGDALDEQAARATELAGWRRDVDHLAAHVDALVAGDPSSERARLESEIATLELAAEAHRQRARAAHARAAEARGRLDGLRRLLGDAALLDGPDHAARARELAAGRAHLAALRGDLAARPRRRQLLSEP